MSHELDEKSVQISTMVIIHAGNARGLVNESLKAAERGDMPTAETKLTAAEEELRNAHRIQTDMIQSEARGETLSFSILLTHAQDTLMVSMSEVHMAKHMLNLYRKLYSK